MLNSLQGYVCSLYMVAHSPMMRVRITSFHCRGCPALFPSDDGFDDSAMCIQAVSERHEIQTWHVTCSSFTISLNGLKSIAMQAALRNWHRTFPFQLCKLLSADAHQAKRSTARIPNACVNKPTIIPAVRVSTMSWSLPSAIMSCLTGVQ